MKLRLFIVFVSLVCILLPGISVAQNKVVVIPLIDECAECPDCNAIRAVTSAGGQVWMDRNLGASRVAGSKSDSLAYGWLYQWGRLADGHESRTSPTTTTRSSGVVPGHGDFITTGTDWISLLPNNNLWQGASGTNNPCPAGFRIPTEAEWQTEIDSWSGLNSASAFASPLKLVVAGQRQGSDGIVYSAGIYGKYWSSTVEGVQSRNLFFDDGDAYMANAARGWGFSVRCIQD